MRLIGIGVLKTERTHNNLLQRSAGFEARRVYTFSKSVSTIFRWNQKLLTTNGKAEVPPPAFKSTLATFPS
jgi:hypothetical protein